MKRILVLSILLIINLCLLVGCSSLPKRKTPLKPAPLPKITSTINVKKLWSTHATSGAKKYYLRLTPAIQNKKVFVADYSGKVAAINAEKGSILWHVDTDVKLTSGISTDAGRLFVATGRGEIISLRQMDGKKLWETPVSSEILATPTAANGVVLAKSLDGSLTALAQNDGKQLWRYSQPVPPLVLHISSQPQVAGGFVVAGFANGKVAVLDLKNGKLIWEKALTKQKGTTVIDRMTDIDASPIVIDGVIYIATYQGNIVALDLYSGRTIWQHKISSYSGIAADNQQIYLSDSKSYIWAFDKKTGAVMWRQTKLSGRMITGPALYNDYIVVADMQGYLHWMSKQNGQFVTRSYLNSSGALTSPVVKDNILYIYTKKGNLYAFKKI